MKTQQIYRVLRRIDRPAALGSLLQGKVGGDATDQAKPFIDRSGLLESAARPGPTMADCGQPISEKRIAFPRSVGFHDRVQEAQ
jgi:hypothetical protein